MKNTIAIGSGFVEIAHQIFPSSHSLAQTFDQLGVHICEEDRTSVQISSFVQFVRKPNNANRKNETWRRPTTKTMPISNLPDPFFYIDRLCGKNQITGHV
jgi:hypothetical protein